MARSEPAEMEKLDAVVVVLFVVVALVVAREGGVDVCGRLVRFLFSEAGGASAGTRLSGST